MADKIREHTPLFFGALTTLATAAIIATASFLWHANYKMSTMIERQNWINKSLNEINTSLSGFETKAHAKEQYKLIWKTDQDQYKSIERNRQSISKMNTRVQRLEDRQR